MPGRKPSSITSPLQHGLGYTLADATAMSCSGKANLRRLKTPPLQYALAYTFADATAMSGLSEATLRRRAKEGLLRLVRVGGRTLVVGGSLRSLIGIDSD